MYSDVLAKLKALNERIDPLRDTLKLEEAEKRLKELDGAMSEQGFWDKRNAERAQEVIAEKKKITGETQPVQDLKHSLSDAIELAELAQAEGEGEHLREIESESGRLE